MTHDRNERFSRLRLLRNRRTRKQISRLAGRVQAHKPVATPPSPKPTGQPPTVSILMASYNCATYIGQAIESVLRQTSPDWELIICDDRSGDKSYKVATEFARRDRRIRVIKNSQRLCCSSNYDKLTREARGRICGVLDGDDCLAESAVETIIKVYDANPELGWLYTQFWWCDSSMKALHLGHSHLPVNDTLLGVEAAGSHCYSHWRTFRTELRDKKVLFKHGLKSAVDKYLGFILEETAPGGFLAMPLYLYRQHSKGITATKGITNCRWSVIHEAQQRRATGIPIYPIKSVTAVP